MAESRDQPRERAQGRRDGGSHGPGPGLTLMPRDPSGNGAGRRAELGSARPGARPLLMARAAVRRGALAKRPGRCRAEGTAAVTGRPRSYPRAWQRCRAGAAPSPQVRPPRLGAPAALLCGGRRPGAPTASVASPACFAGAPNARARAGRSTPTTGPGRRQRVL